MHSIQDYLKKINSSIRFSTIASLVCILIAVLAFWLYLRHQQNSTKGKISYQFEAVDQGAAVEQPLNLTRPFGSRHGTTYTYSWCAGTAIKKENIIVFSSAEEAEKQGRRLSKLCRK